MTYQELAAHFGPTQHKIAKAVGVKQPTICVWKKKGIPHLQQARIQLMTGGLLKADL